jgi:hypothetical protein
MLFFVIIVIIGQLLGQGHTLAEPESEITTCGKAYTKCAANGVFDVAVDLVDLYKNLANTINDDHASVPVKRDELQTPSILPRDVATMICCMFPDHRSRFMFPV